MNAKKENSPKEVCGTRTKPPTREELEKWWPFQRVDGKWLTRLQKQEKKSQDEYEESPI